ncbi:glycosyltransferase family 2 protein [Sphingopyxis sp. NJF-3]
MKQEPSILHAFDIVETGMEIARARICVIVVTYNRIKSLERLLASLQRADYGGDAVDLMISIDGGEVSKTIYDYASGISWPFGRLAVRRFQRNLGLRRHILNCGALAHDYDAIILLEDDIVVGPNFHAFTRQAIDHYSNDERIAGISLYAPSHNEMADLPFQPMLSGFSVYCLQSAQSWGQCWTRKMWADFEAWYVAYGDMLLHAPDMPERIYSWPKSSWKKFAMKYLAETGKTWLYPYRSHTTNCSEVGTHNRQVTAIYQVGLSHGNEKFAFAPLEDLIHYDLYFERKGEQLRDSLRVPDDQPLILDLYGTRQQVVGPAHLLTTRILPRAPLQSFGFAFKPQEMNITMATAGDLAGLYQIDVGETVDLCRLDAARPRDYFSSTGWRDQLHAGLQGLKAAITRRLKR